MKDNVTADRRGVVIRVPRQWEAPKPTETPVERRQSDAYIMAMANKHKPWARRWLRSHGHWL
jgi:hypothetical protein